MARYWLGDSQLDRWVFRSLRRFVGAGVFVVHTEVCKRLRVENIVQASQILPSEDDVWCSLQRLTGAKKVDKYVYEDAKDRYIHYRVRAMK